MTFKEAENLAEKLIKKLDTVARDVDSYEYGLPVFSIEGMARLKLAAIEVLLGCDETR